MDDTQSHTGQEHREAGDGERETKVDLQEQAHAADGHWFEADPGTSTGKPGG